MKEKLRRLFGPKQKRTRNVVYTCMFGHSEHFEDRDYGDRNVDYICFTDDAELAPKNWQPILVQHPTMDPARFSKRHKHLPHLHLAGYERSIYVDNTVKLKVEPSSIFERYADDSLVMFKHPRRECVYEEAVAVSRYQLDDPAIVQRQMEVYKKSGDPEKNGLNAAGFLLRTHANESVAKAMLEWHSQLLLYSKRDQLGWNFAAWATGVAFTTVDEDVHNNSIFDWPALTNPVRVPRDFDNERYLSLNEDVRQLDIDPRKHYLHFGHAEGRKYR